MKNRTPRESCATTIFYLLAGIAGLTITIPLLALALMAEPRRQP